MWELIIFDLDGTLLDTSEGIFNSVRYAEKMLGLSPVSGTELREFVGPPPKEMYRKKYGLSEEAALSAVKRHREYGMSKALYESAIYEGVEDTLKYLKSRKKKLAVATLKGQAIAEKILEINGLKKYFDTIVGMNADETYTKCDTIRIAMENTGCKTALMVGDSEYDRIGSKEAGIDFVGALYGFGLNAELQYPFNTINRMIELISIIR